MRTHKVLLSLLAAVSVGIAGAAASGCHAEMELKTGANQPPAPPPPPPPAMTIAEPPPPPPPPEPPKKVVALKGVQMKSATQIDMPGDIEFQKASSKIVMNDKTKKVLMRLATIMKDNPEVTRLSIEGNTDNEGESKGFDNEKLSQQRSQAVVEWLAKNGVETKRLSAIGNGSKHPLATNDTPEHMAENRRVEFHVRGFNGQPVGGDDEKASPSGPSAAASVPPGSAAPVPSTAPGTDATRKAQKKDKDK